MKTLRRSLVVVCALLISGIFIQSVTDNSVLTNDAFQTGEYLKYSLHYGWLDGGVAYLNIEEKEYEGKKVHHATALAKTVGIADKLYNVRDIYESYIDIETGLPIKSIRNVKEGNYKKYNEVLYNRHENTIDSKLSGKHAVPANIGDMVSIFYYARRAMFKNLKKGETIKFDTYFDDKVYTLEVRYMGNETIKSKVGNINCMKFKPVVEPGRIFDTEDDLEIWVSNDRNFIPIRVQINFFVGSIKCDLEKYTGLKNKLITQ